MKKSIYILMMTLLAVMPVGAVSTTDKLVLSDVTLNPGDGTAKYATLSVVGAVRKYAAFNVDIYLPEGVEPVLSSTGVPRVTKTGILPKDDFDDEYLHTLSATYSKEDNKINVICYASPTADFTSMQGVLCRVYLTASTYAKPGKASVELKKQNLTTADETKYEPADASYDITIGTSAKADLSVSSANKWSTVILPFATELPAGVKAYTCNSKNDEEKVFYLTEATQINAYTPYILYSENGYTGTLQGEVDASLYPEAGYVTSGYLTGAVKSQTTNEGYILQKLNGVVKFYKADAEKTYNIPAGKCWATPTDAEQDSYDFKFAPTAVMNVKAANAEDARCYDITGRNITEPRKGHIYIQNGKKFTK